MSRIVPVFFLLASCGAEPEPCALDDRGFVERAFPLVLGRHPKGSVEAEIWTEIAEKHGRPAVVRGLLDDPEAMERWRDFLLDALAIARAGDRNQAACYGAPLLDGDDGDLARWLATADPAGSAWPTPFTMGDVVASAIRADDLSAVWRANLFARMGRPSGGANVGPRALEEIRRASFGENFQHTYLNRDFVCMKCHNSNFSVTDDADPEKDRHFPTNGLFERALFGADVGRDPAEVFQLFRYEGVLTGVDMVTPWGMDPRCGAFAPPTAVPTADFLSQDGYFLGELAQRGSVWDVEAALAEGVTGLARAGGLTVGADGEVGGSEAFAWMVAENLASRLWREALGAPLTIANYFPRNAAQRDRLQHLAETLAKSRFSLADTLVEITSDPLFLATPTCDSGHTLEPAVNPWSREDDDPERRGNGAGDLVFRHRARTLVRAAHAAMDWPMPDAFLADGDPFRTVELALGAFVRESEPGFDGTNFQGLLAFEAVYGACQPPDAGAASDGCEATPTVGGCASCGCQACACAADPYCCDVQWDDRCVETCNEDCGGCGGGLSASQGDALDRLITEGVRRGATLGEVEASLKDRLVARGLDPVEQRLVDALVGASPEEPVSVDHEAGLRAYCGAILVSPSFQLALDRGMERSSVVPIRLDEPELCANADERMGALGLRAPCAEGR